MKRANHHLIKAVIFDMDGVLVDSERVWFQTTKAWLSGLTHQPFSEQEEASITGKSVPDIYRSLNERYALPISEQEFFATYMQLAKDVYMRRALLMPHARETLEAIRRSKIALALASSSPHSWIGMTLSRFALAPYFSVIVSSEDVGFRGKPAPDIYVHAAKKLETAPAHCLAVEDSANGILSAKASGMIAIGYQTSHNQNQNLKTADAIITDLIDIASYLHENNQA